MNVFKRKWVIVSAVVAGFVIVLAGVGLVSRSTSSTATPPVVVTAPAASVLPPVTWYWTMAVSPTGPKVLVLGTSGGVWRSTDAGKTWTQSGLKGVNTTSVVRSGSSLLAAGVRSAVTAGPVIQKTGGTLKERSAPPGPAVFATSADGGKTWKIVSPAGLPKVAIQSLAVDPGNAKTVYALTTSGAFYRSTDGARSFTLVSPKLGIPPWAIAVTQGTNFVSGDMDNGSHVSSNGKSWQPTPFTDGRGTHMVMEYAVDPNDPTRILMASIGVELSTDSGKTWQPSLKSQVMFGPIAWVGGSSTEAYAAGFDGSVWHTTDGGKTWSSS